MTWQACVLWAALTLVAGAAHAAHITDKLLAGLYPKPEASGKPLQLLVTGTPVEEIKQKGSFTEVRLSDGTRGWIQTEYLTEEKPASVKLLELQAETGEIKQQLAEAQATHTADQQRIAEMERSQGEAGRASSLGSEAAESLASDLARARAEIASLRAQLQAASRYQAERATWAEGLEREMRTLQNRIGRAAVILGGPAGEAAPDHRGSAAEGLWQHWRYWIFAAALVLSFAAGYALLDYRLRRRYGRFRL